MTMYAWVAAAATLALMGAAGAGWWMAQRVLRADFQVRMRKVVDTLRHQHSAATDKLRSAHGAVQMELERQRTSMHRQVAAATAEARGTAVHLEDQLRMAYAELDRLRMQDDHRSRRGRMELDDGFALTQPWTGGL